MDKWNSRLVCHLVRVGVLSIASVVVFVIFGTEWERRAMEMDMLHMNLARFHAHRARIDVGGGLLYYKTEMNA